MRTNRTYKPAIHHRRSIRLKGYDYSQEGLYFVTLCVQNRQCLFGKIVGAGSTRPNNDNAVSIGAGEPQWAGEPHWAGEPRPYVPTLGNMIAYFKYQTTKQIDLPTNLWQRNYFEHIIRNEKSYQFIADYIFNNPAKWESDKFYSE